MRRRPDFVLIGAMKAGTTTLFRRLGQLEDIDLPVKKEPHFFSKEEAWSRGIDWYASLFSEARGITGEASASYSDASTAMVVAERMSHALPDARLLYALRHPVDRMRSHYQHEVLRARESRPFPEAVAEPNNKYLTGSMYGEVVNAYLHYYPRAQIHIYRLDHLDTPDTATWDGILQHIGSAPASMPVDRYNETSSRVQFTPLLKWLWDRDLVPSIRMPAPLRKAGIRLLTRPRGAQSSLLESAASPIDDRLHSLLLEDQTKLIELTGDPGLGWRSL